jgi:hypothetical protein
LHYNIGGFSLGSCAAQCGREGVKADEIASGIRKEEILVQTRTLAFEFRKR